MRKLKQLINFISMFLHNRNIFQNISPKAKGIHNFNKTVQVHKTKFFDWDSF